MVSASTVAPLIADYAKHGWVLRRALLIDPDLDAETSALFADADVIPSDINALWFSRSSRPDRETWELRRLTGTPYAIDAFLDDTMTEEIREEILANVEDHMRESKIAFSGH
jgi:hypothetical protein